MPSSDTYFKKGISGNPKGSSKKARSRKPRTMTEALAQLVEEYEKKTGKDEEGNPERGLPLKLIKKLVDDTLASGDPKRIEMLWERFDGAVTKEIKIHAEVQTTVQSYLELAEPVIKEWFQGLIEQQVSSVLNMLASHGAIWLDENTVSSALHTFSQDVYPKGDPARWLHKKLILAWADYEDSKRTHGALH